MWVIAGGVIVESRSILGAGVRGVRGFRNRGVRMSTGSDILSSSDKPLALSAWFLGFCSLVAFLLSR